MVDITAQCSEGLWESLRRHRRDRTRADAVVFTRQQLNALIAHVTAPLRAELAELRDPQSHPLMHYSHDEQCPACDFVNDLCPFHRGQLGGIDWMARMVSTLAQDPEIASPMEDPTPPRHGAASSPRPPGAAPLTPIR